MKQAREMRKIKLEEHKAKKRGEQQQHIEEEDNSDASEQPSPTNSVDEQNAPHVAPGADPEPSMADVPMTTAQEPTDMASTTPSSGLLCGCI